MAHRLLLWVLSALATLATLTLLLVAGALWYGHTQSALDRVVAEAISRSGGRLRVEGAVGSVLGPFAFASIEWKDQTLSIVARNVQGTWSPLALLSKQLHVSELSVAQLTVALTSKEQAAAATVPESLALPLALAVDRLAIEALEAHFDAAMVQASAIELSYLADETGHHVRGLRFDSELASIRGDADLAPQRPFGLNAKIAFSRRDPRAPVEGGATLAGDLSRSALRFQAAVGAARVDGVADLRPFDSNWLPSLSLEIKGADLAQFDSTWPRTDLSLSGKAASAADGTLAGSFEITNAAAGTLGDHLLPVQRARGEFGLADRQVRLSGLRIALSGGGSATGSASLAKGGIGIDLALAAVDLRAMHRPLRSTRLAGTVRARVSDDGVTASALLREKDLSLALEILQRGDQLDLRQFRAEARGGSLAGSGRLTLANAMPFAVNARAGHLNPAAFGDFVAGSIDAEIAATGALRPQWSAEVRLRIEEHSRLRGLHLGGGGHFVASPTRVSDAALRLHVERNALDIHGSFGQIGDHLDFKLDAPQLKQVDPSLEGKLSSAGVVSGTVAAPSISFEAHGSALRIGAHYAMASLDATGAIAAADGHIRLEITGKELVAPQGELATVSFHLNGTVSAHDGEFTATGPQIDARLTIQGGWHDGVWRGKLVTLQQRGELPITLLQPVPIELGRNDVQLSDLLLEVDTGRLTVRHLRWGAPGLASDGEFHGIPAALLMRLAAVGANVRSTVFLGGEWSVVASPRLNGELRIRREAGDLAARDIAGVALGLTAFDVDARIDNDALAASVSATSAQFGTATMRLDAAPRAGSQAGTLDFDDPARLSASFKLASLRALEVFTGTNAVVDGRLTATIEGAGTLGGLRLTGQIEGEDLRIDAPQYGVAIGNGRLRADLRDDELRVTELVLFGGDGQFVATGTLPLGARAGEPSTVQWKADKFTLLNRPDSRLVLDGAGALTREAGRIALAGSLRALEGHFESASDDTTRLSDDVVIKGRTGPAFDNSRGPLTRVPLKLDFDLDLGPRLIVIARGFEGRLAGRVKVTTGEDGTLLANGRVTTVNGTYLAFGQRLVLERGDIYFDGPIANPSLDFLALRRNLPVEVGIAVTGTARAPRAKLTSNPPMPEGEMLSWLVLGHGLDRTASNDNAALQSAAALLFQSTVGSTGTRTVASVFGLDDISVHGRATGAEGQVLSVGRRIADNLYIAFDQGLTIATNALRVEYSLSRNWMLRAEAGVVSSFGIYYTESFR